MKVQDIIEMNKHDKQTIYEAYSLEHHQRKHLNKLLNDERRKVAGFRYSAQFWQDKWLEDNIRANVKVEGDLDEAIDYYFSHPNRYLATTPDNGYYAYVIEPDHIFILFAWTNPKAWKREMVNMVNLIYEIGQGYLPVRYTGKFDVMRNHSIEIEPGLYQLKL